MLSEHTHLHQLGFKHIAGVDDAGRGPLAGPVTAAAVILDIDHYHELIRDSKTMTEKQKDAMYEYITEHAIAWHVTSITPKIIDDINIGQAGLRAMATCVKKLEVQPDFVLTDAFNINVPEIPQKAIIGGDGKVFSIAAASIIAKVTRDRLMQKYHKKYPQYGFNQHVGYGTVQHLEALKKFGPCPIHRKSFAPIREILVQSECHSESRFAG